MAKPKTTRSKKAPAKSASKKLKLSVISKNLSISSLRQKVIDRKNRKSLIIAVVIIILAVLLFFGRGLFIAATVNGQPVSRLSVINELEKQSGKAVLDYTIERMLVKQEAKNNSIGVSSEEVKKEIDRLTKQFKDEGQDLSAYISSLGYTQEQFSEQIEFKLLVTKILGDDIKVTDKEFNDFLSSNTGIIPEGADEKAAKDSLRAQLEEQKLKQKYQEWIQKIRNEAKINFFVDY